MRARRVLRVGQVIAGQIVHLRLDQLDGRGVGNIKGVDTATSAKDTVLVTESPNNALFNSFSEESEVTVTH